MRFARVLKTVLVGATALLWIATASAQQIRFIPDFTSVTNLQLNTAHQATYNSQKVLRLTDGYPGFGIAHPETATAWFTLQQPVSSGFTTYFKFQIHTAGICCTPGDGLAFVIQNAASTDATYGATGAGITARGAGAGGVGYAGIPNSLAVEFDTVADRWDPSANHVALQGCGTASNGPVHIPGTFTIGNNHNVTSCLVASGINSAIPHLGVTCGNTACADGNPHEVVVEYTPPATVSGNGTLVVWIDPTFITGTHTPVASAPKALNIPYNINNAYNSKGISLAGGTSAWVGFTASQTSQPQAHDILAWEFTPHVQTQVTQVIPPGGTEADYTFGGHHMGVNYFPAFQNNGCDGTTPTDPCEMTVVSTPISRSVFYRTRLMGTPFINEQCVVYLQTGGNCIVYSVTCQKKSNPLVNVACPVAPTCNTVGDTTNCISFNTSFYTSDPITAHNADYLKTDPIGSNNWVSIFVTFDPNVLDGKTTGTGNSPSDFVATFALGTRP